MNRHIGIDYGDKRIGIALSDPMGMTALPHDVIPNDGSHWKALVALIEEKQVVKIVMGLPLDLEGNDSKKAADVRQFAKTLEKKTTLPIQFWDERFSSKAAIRQLSEAGLSHKKQRGKVDAMAAVFILQGVLDQA
ncbi:Holliday junction resolvase RuvX [bacterium]|jgi:putative holliday junction resolvase|nr:Holliday junction resolvase RuvX [bacterium]